MAQKIESLSDAAFAINGHPYQKGSARITGGGNLVGIAEIGSNVDYSAIQPYTEYTDNLDAPFASAALLRTYLGTNIMQ